jgi:hypothetical protein
LAFSGVVSPTLAWVYPEHRDIAVLSVEKLDAQRKAIFDRLWAEAREGAEQRLCEQGADLSQSSQPRCIDWAAMSAISGDHSCSSAQMLDTVIHSDWILPVADIAAKLKVDLAGIASATPPGAQPVSRTIELQRLLDTKAARAQRTNALRRADIHLQRADPEYATRAGSNNAHFLLARPGTDTTAEEFLRLALSDSSELNAIGVWAWYHLGAMQKATRLAHEPLPAAARRELARSALADEAFSLHFLEDAFAAGHVAGTWGDVSLRKGTHDYYNENGLEVYTWAGGATTKVLMGDAHMRPEDAARAADAVRDSLEELLDTAAGRAREANLPYTPGAPSQPERFDVCANERLPPWQAALKPTPEAVWLEVAVLQQVPIPGLGEGLGALPRFHAEIGPFLGIGALLDGRYLGDSFINGQSGAGWIFGADLELRAGYGLEGVLDDAGDGLIFAALGYRGDTSSTREYAAHAGSLSAAIPGRSGFSTRVRMPFYLVPGDLLLAAPLYFVAPGAYQKMAVTAANGGLIPWQLGWATRFGRFQFVLGREIGAAFYGSSTAAAPGTTTSTAPILYSFKSTFVDLPVIEFRPFRAFDTRQSAQLIIQLFVGADIPSGGDVTFPAGTPREHLKTVYSVGLRADFDWRRYF